MAEKEEVRDDDGGDGGGGGCPVCGGSGTIELLASQCPFCNGTGEHTRSAEAYLRSHICQCVLLDRVRCPLCGKKCHHDTPNRPKVLAGPA